MLPPHAHRVNCCLTILVVLQDCDLNQVSRQIGPDVDDHHDLFLLVGLDVGGGDGVSNGPEDVLVRETVASRALTYLHTVLQILSGREGEFRGEGGPPIPQQVRGFVRLWTAPDQDVSGGAQEEARAYGARVKEGCARARRRSTVTTWASTSVARAR